jgi:probable HAF family extracellular repeat protein
VSEAKYGLDAGLNEFAAPMKGDIFLPGGINDAGQVIGVGGGSSVSLWENGSFQSLESAFPENLGVVPNAINNLGQATGWVEEESNTEAVQAFLLTGGSFSILGSPIGETDSYGGFGLNESGQVVGGVEVLSQQPAGNGIESFHAVVWLSGPGSGQVIAENAVSLDINDSAQVVYTSFGLSVPEGFLWDNGITMNLGTLGGAGTQAIGLNNLGQVVGSSFTAQAVPHAFVWSDGEMIDLNDRIGGAPVTLVSALDIKDSGIILCQTGTDLYLLTPVGD